jgi:hypothetical protein
MKKVFSVLTLTIIISVSNCFAQTADTTLVREKYLGTKLLRVLHDFETKYHLTLKYDSVLVAPYNFDWVYLRTELRLAFEAIFRVFEDLAYYEDEQGAQCIMLKKNLPKNRTRLENRQFEGDATRRNLTVTGRIKDQPNGELLPFATVYVESDYRVQTSTNTDGYFTLYNVPTDKETLIFKYLGYETQHFYLSPEMNVANLFVELQPAANILDEILIVTEREDVLKIPEQSIGVIRTTAAKIADLPALDEKDLFRTFQLMPGISAANESSAEHPTKTLSSTTVSRFIIRSI